MYPGWIIIGTQDPIGFPGEYTEIVNNTRAYAYAEYAGLCWLQDCDDCDAAGVVTPGYPYKSPIVDPAPWYEEDDPDSWGFLGVIGIDVDGADSSTRQANVSMSLSGVGVIGPQYMGPRTMVIRALAIATDECSLQYGLAWLRQQYGHAHDPCAGDTMTFFDCCPCTCSDDSANVACWPDNYGELKGTPRCLTSWWPLTYIEEITGPPDSSWWPDTYEQETTPDGDPVWWPTTYAEETGGPGSVYWPDTYAELIVGPPETAEGWCTWIDTYEDLREGPPDWSCCVDACVMPYMRQFYNVRVTEGPTVLQKPALRSKGAVAEIEFTIVAGDPAIHAMVQRSGRGWFDGSTPLVESTSRPPVFQNPYRPSLTPPPVPVPALADSWVRDTLVLKRLEDQVLPEVTPVVRVRANERSGPVRLGLWAGDQRVGGYTIPFVAARSSIIVNGRDAFYRTPGGYERIAAFVKDWDGKWPGALELPHGDYTLTIDQDADRPVRLLVDVALAPVGSS